MGTEPIGSEIPSDPVDLPLNAQYALLLLNALPDMIGGMSGTWLGKDFSGLMDIMDIYQIEEKKEVFEYLLVCISVLSKHHADQHNIMESQAKSKAKIRS